MPLSEEASNTFEQCRTLSNSGLMRMRNLAAETFENDNKLIIGVNGSYARREVTTGSDVDLFFLYLGDDPDIHEKQQTFRELLIKNCLLYTSPSPRDRG